MATQPPSVFVTFTPTPFRPLPPSTPEEKLIADSVPRLLRGQVESLFGDVSLTLDISRSSDSSDPNAIQIQWIYVLVAPFPTIRASVTSNELRAAWNGMRFSNQPLLMTESTLRAFKALWGEPVPGSVRSVDESQLLDTAWTESAYAIIPFESLSPRWKVLTIDDQSPIRKGFDSSRYPLKVSFTLQTPTNIDPSSFILHPLDNAQGKPSNYDSAKLTTVLLTGVTALVRATAFKMEQRGITYPGEEVRGVMRDADITHVSNEVPFSDDCPPPNPNSRRLIFCSDPKYIGLLNDVGADVVELTGNHYADYGRAAMEQTIAIYKSNQLDYYGGGLDLQDSFEPALFEINGSKIAFLGCNRPDVGGPKVASETRPGAAPCDFDYFTAQVAALKTQGYLVIFTFQWYEDYAAAPNPGQEDDFRRMADAGAAIVSGSQAHYPKIMEFHDEAFIHYGLGNLFFDQMGNLDWMPDGIRREFLDRYVIYDGKLISVELITTLLEDFARPRLMTDAERAAFLQDYFTASGWTPILDGSLSSPITVP